MNSSCYPFFLLPSVFPSIRVFSNKSPVHIRWPKYWSFSFSISTSYKYSGLISFRIDWFHLLAVQGTLWSLLQHYSLKASILRHSACFMGFPCGSDGKASARNVGDPGSIPGSGRSPGEGNGSPLQYSCLENPMDGGAWWATVHGVTKRRTRLSSFTFTFTFRTVDRDVGYTTFIGNQGR